MAAKKNAYESQADYGLTPGAPSPLISYPDPPASRMIPPAPGPLDAPLNGSDRVSDDITPSEDVADATQRPLGSSTGAFDDAPSGPKQYQTNTSSTPGTSYGSAPNSSTRGKSRARMSTQR